MTTARIVGALPEGCGLTSSLNGAIYDDLIRKDASPRLIAIVELEPIGTGQRKTAKGRHQHVELQIKQLEPLDRSRGDDVDRAFIMLEQARGRRHEPRQLTVTGDGEADRLELLRLCQKWADDTGRDLDAEWSVQFGDDFVAKPDKASIFQLKQFAHLHGVIDENPVDEGDEPEAGVELEEGESGEITGDGAGAALPEFTEPAGVGG